MNTQKTITNALLTAFLVCALILSACAPETPAPTPTATLTPSPTPRPPERNVALNKPVRVSASWIIDPPERAVNGNPNDWWGAGGPAPQWIEVDLLGIYTVSRIKVINEGPTGYASYPVYGRGPDRVNRLLYVFEGIKTNNQSLEYSPETPWTDISTIRIEIPSGSGWAGFREVQVYSREDPEPLLISAESALPSFLAQVDTNALEPITPENSIFMEQIAMLGRGTIHELTWSPDGTKLAAASPIGVWLYDPAELDSSPRLLEGHTREVLGAAFSPDGTTILSGSQDGTVKEWDAATGSLKRTIPLWDDFNYEVNAPTRDPEVWSLAFNPDGQLMAAGSLDGALRLWNLASGRQEAVLSGHTRTINRLAFSPDGALLASSSMDGAIFVWNVETRSRQADLSGSSPVQSLVFSPDGKFLAYGGDGMSPRIWDTAVSTPPIELTEPESVLNLAFHPNGKTLASSGMDGRIRFFEIESGSTMIFKEDAGWNINLAFSPDGKTLATYGWDGALRLWNVVSGEQKDVEETHTNAVTSVAFNPEYAQLATGSHDGIVRLWNLERNELGARLRGHNGRVYSLAFSPDGTLLASSGFDRTVRLWDSSTGEQVRVLEGHTSYIRCVAFNPDGTWVASGSADKTVRLWDSATGEEHALLTGFAGEVQSLAFSPDGMWLLTAVQDSTLRLWEVATGKEVGIVGRHLSPEMSAAFSPDGALIASGSGDHALHVWEWKVVNGVASGSKHFTSIGHPGWVMSVAFSPLGGIIAEANTFTASIWVAPGEIHLYSSETGFPLALLRGHTKRVTSIAFSHDGKLLASGSADGTVRLWGIRQVEATLVSQAAAGLPTPTTTAMPSTQSAAWRDDFDGSLAADWRWVNEKPDMWNLTENPGFLRIYASHANTGSQNLLLRPAPQGDFVITTHVFFEPKTNFQIAGLVIYQDSNNLLQFGRAFCDFAGACVGNGLYFDNVQGGNFIGSNYGTLMDIPDEAYLRLEHKGDTVTAFFSYEGINWFELGAHSLPPGFRIVGVGLTAAGDNTISDKDIPANFDFFEFAWSQ